MEIIKKYHRAFIISMQNTLEYRFNFLISLVGIFIPIAIQIYLWTAIYSNSSNTKIYSYTYSEMITYVVLAGLVSKLVSAGFETKIAREIKDGGLSRYLIQPISHFLYYISCFIGEKIIHSGIMLSIITFSILALNFVFRIDISIQLCFLFVITLFLAIIINFILFYILGLLGFYMQEVWGILYGAQLALSIVSGGILPLETFGEKMLRIFSILPFKYITYFPINVITGNIGNKDILVGIMIQIIWIFLLGIISKIIWLNGLKKYIAVGG